MRLTTPIYAVRFGEAGSFRTSLIGRGASASSARRMEMSESISTPREDGFSMPAEWEPHEACLMEWPTVTREAFWAERPRQLGM